MEGQNSSNQSPITVKPDKTRLITLLEELALGNIKVPVFQRDFVWKPNQMIELFDSVFKGYPIGSLLFWRPISRFETKKVIGPYKVKDNSNIISYVLDGYQRITTLFGVLSNPEKVERDHQIPLKPYSIYYNLKEKEFTYLKNKKEKSSYLIPLYKVVDTYEFLDFLREIEREIIDKTELNELIENAKQLSKILYDYEIPFVEIRGGDIKSAVEIFSRVNSTGMEISEDFMLSALSYNSQTNFLFSDHITVFLNSLKQYNFDLLKRDTVLNCISTAKGKIYFDVKLEDLLSPDLEGLTNSAFEHIKKAVKFLYEQLFVLDLRLLPYPTQLIFLSEFFRLNPSPNPNEIEKLKKWFWTTSYSSYFTIYSLSQHRSAYKVFCEFAIGNNEDGIYKLNPDEKFVAAAFPEKLNFTGVRTKTLQLFLLKQICNDGLIEENVVGLKELFVFNNKDRTPANIILRLSSDFENNKGTKQVVNFLTNTDISELNEYFIDERLVNLFINDDIETFLAARSSLIKEKEKAFVEGLDIKYENNTYDQWSVV